MARGPDRATEVSFVELRAMLKEIDRIKLAFEDAVSLEGSSSALCTYNYKSGSVAIQQLGNFANALADASFRLRSGRPYVADELKPRSTAKGKTAKQQATEISQEITRRREAKKAKRKSQSE